MSLVLIILLMVIYALKIDYLSNPVDEEPKVGVKQLINCLILFLLFL